MKDANACVETLRQKIAAYAVARSPQEFVNGPQIQRY